MLSAELTPEESTGALAALAAGAETGSLLLRTGSAATVVGGKGGGRPDLAQAGGKLVDQLPAALEAARKSIQQLLGG